MRSLATLFPVTLALLAMAPHVHAQTVLFSDDFEHGYGNWTTTGLWHPQASTDTCGSLHVPFPSGTHDVYYGLDGQCDYDTPGSANSGTLTLASPVMLPANAVTAKLRFWSFLSTEPCFPDVDQATVQVSADGGQSWTSVGNACLGPKLSSGVPWIEWDVNLTPFLGSSIQVRFSFDTLDSLENQYFGWMIDNVSIRIEAGTPYCEATSCPCNNGNYFAFAGCTNSTRHGAQLSASGLPSISSDNVVLTATEMPAVSVASFLQSDSAIGINGIPFGDGVSCLAGSTLRLATKSVTNGSASFPGSGDAALSIGGMIPPAGATRFYQALFRDPAPYCTAATFNTTNGYRMTWVP